MTTATPTSGGETRASAGFIGSLAHTPLAEVFRRLVEEQRSGDLQVTGPSAIKMIYFDRGFIVFASSSLKADRFGESMIEAGRISRHQFALASMLMRSNKSKFGQALVDAGIISDEELGCNVALQVNRIVLSLFSFKKGMYSFDERPSNIPVEMMVSLSSYRILIEGVRRMSSKGLVTIGLPALDTEVKIVNQAPFSLDIEQLRPVEKQVLKSVGDGASLRKIVEAVDGQEVEAVVIDDASLEMEIELEEEALVDFDESEEAELASSGEAPEPAASLATDVESSRLESSTQPEPASVASARKMERPIQKGEESRILRDVKLHFRTKDWEGAVWLIERLVKIAPSKGTYRGMLARAMSRHPVMRKDAEAHFVAALRLAPQDPELHYWLGLYYQSFGLKSRAVTEFRATLHIAPRHEGARKQLSGEKKADSLSALVKRIFE